MISCFRTVYLTEYSHAVHYRLIQPAKLYCSHYLDIFKFQFLDGNLKFMKSLL